MEITGTTSQAQNFIRNDANVEQTEALYQVKLMKMQQESSEVVGDLLQDTAEISQEAMDKYLAEKNG